MKEKGFFVVLGAIGSAIATAFGGWDKGLETLVILMAIDYIAGMTCAGVFHKSKKTQNGALESRAGFKGLCRKCTALLFVLVSYRLDLLIGCDYIRDAVIIGFCANECISILENAGLMGIYIPPAVEKAIEVLKTRENEGGQS